MEALGTRCHAVFPMLQEMREQLCGRIRVCRVKGGCLGHNLKGVTFGEMLTHACGARAIIACNTYQRQCSIQGETYCANTLEGLDKYSERSNALNQAEFQMFVDDRAMHQVHFSAW